MLTHGAFEDPEFIKCSQWLDKFRTEYQRVIVNDLWYNHGLCSPATILLCRARFRKHPASHSCETGCFFVAATESPSCPAFWDVEFIGQASAMLWQCFMINKNV